MKHLAFLLIVLSGGLSAIANSEISAEFNLERAECIHEFGRAQDRLIHLMETNGVREEYYEATYVWTRPARCIVSFMSLDPKWEFEKSPSKKYLFPLQMIDFVKR